MADFAEFPFDRLPRMSRAEARARTAWADAGPLRALQAGAGPLGEALGAELRVRTGTGWRRAGSLPAESDRPTALLEGPASVGLTLETELADALLARALGAERGEPTAGPLRDVERGVLAYVLGRWLAGSPWRVAAVLEGPAPLCVAPAMIRWPLQIGLGPTSHAADLWLPPLAPPAVRHPGPHAAELPIALRVEVGDARLPAGDVGSLAVDDVLVPDRVTVDAEGRGEAMLRGGPWRWRAERTGAGWRIEAEEETMSEIEEALEAAADEPVTLTIELARLSVPLGEVATLAPGAVLETGRPIGGSVVIRTARGPIARGELVDVDGEVGVRVVSLAAERG